MSALEAYAPSSAAVLWGLGLALVAVLACGHLLVRVRPVALARAAAWTIVLGCVLGAHLALLAEPPGFRMLALVALLLYSMKAVVAVESRAAGGAPLSLAAWLAFSLGWFGMRPRLFAERREPRAGAGALLARGLRNLALGLALIALARWTWTASGSRALASVPLLAGLSLVLHFGVFHVLAALWRGRGVDVQPLFRAPLRSRSLKEFWGRRWNLAFSEMTSLAVFRPLRARVGAGPAVTVAFLFSGLLHELAISVPVRAGYGLPTAYFVLHAFAMQVERPLAARGLLTGWRGRAWTAACLILPAPVLFHPPFLRGTMWPLVGMG